MNTKKYISILIATLCFFLSACNNRQSSTDEEQKENNTEEKNILNPLPPVKNLYQYPGTKFLPTPSHPVEAGKNAVYCATMLMAWGEIKASLLAPARIGEAYPDLKLLNTDESHKNVLSEGEYEANGRVEGNNIYAYARLAFSLPFETEFNRYDNYLSFESTPVASFGFFGTNAAFEKIAYITQYDNDDNFIVMLSPEDKAHEIYLFKSEKSYKTLKDMLHSFNTIKEKASQQRTNGGPTWKEVFLENDRLLIPVLGFNIETNYKSLEGSTFESNGQTFTIQTAYQRTAFVLNEKGAAIESEAVFDSASNEEKPQPKNLVFDKPFYIILKKRTADMPYFCAYIGNTEFMTLK